MTGFANTDITSDKLQSNSSPAHRGQHNNLNAAVRQLFSLTYDAREYGAEPDSSSDELAHLQDAVDAISAAGGGTLRLLAGTYLVSDVLTIESSGVVIEGAGPNTIIKRTGADTSPVVWIRTPDGEEDKILDPGLRRLTVDGNGAAGNAVRFTTVNSADFQSCIVKGATAWQVYMDCWDDRPVGGDARDNQDNVFQKLRLQATGSAGGLRLTGNSSPDANTSLNRFDSILTTFEDGDAFYFGNCDGNISSHLRVFRNGTGRGLVLGAGAVVNKGHARHNQFFGIQMTAADVYSLAGTQDSGPNLIMGLSMGNGGNSPNISSGATLYWLASDGTGNLP